MSCVLLVGPADRAGNLPMLVLAAGHDLYCAPDPERALAVVHMSGRSRGSGVPSEMHFGQIWETRGGRFKRMRMFTDVEQARRAAGLDP